MTPQQLHEGFLGCARHYLELGDEAAAERAMDCADACVLFPRATDVDVVLAQFKDAPLAEALGE